MINKDFLKSKLFLVNIVIAISVIFILFFIIFNRLDSYTGHNDYVEVPDFTGFTIAEMDAATESKDLRYYLVDSVFDSKAKKGTVLKQTPLPGEMVKKDRTVYVTVNALRTQKVKLPNLLHKSVKLAEAQLKVRGLNIGAITYAPDLAKDVVLSMSISGRTVTQGQEVAKGSIVDLVLGSGSEGESISVPNLVGQTYQQALESLKMEGLKIGHYKFEKGVTDTANAVVIKQIPDYASGNQINIGGSIDIILSK